VRAVPLFPAQTGSSTWFGTALFGDLGGLPFFFWDGFSGFRSRAVTCFLISDQIDVRAPPPPFSLLRDFFATQASRPVR